jgi:hypothetical protein
VGHDALRFGWMVRDPWYVSRLAELGGIPSDKNAFTFSGRRGGYSFDLAVAETGFHYARSTFGSQVRVFPDTRGGES